MGGARQRRGGDHQEALGVGQPLVVGELVRRGVADHLVVAFGRAQILADGQEIHVGGAQIVHHPVDFARLLAEPHHDSGLGKDRRILALHRIEQAERVVVARAGPHLGVEPGHRLQVVVVDVRAGGGHRFDGAGLVAEVRGEDLDGGAGRGLADARDRTHELGGPAVVEIVAVHRGDDHVVEAEGGDRSREFRRLARVHRLRPAGRHVAEGAGPGAHRAQDHDGGVALGPALADIGAGGFFTHGVQPVRAHQPPGGVVGGRGRRLDPEPAGLGAPRRARVS